MTGKINRPGSVGGLAQTSASLGKASQHAADLGGIGDIQKMAAEGEAVAESLGAATIENQYNSSI